MFSGVSRESGRAIQVGGTLKHGSHLPSTVTATPRIIATQVQRGKRVGCKESGCWMPCRSLCAVMDGPFRVENTRCGRSGIRSARRSVIALTSTLSTRWKSSSTRIVSACSTSRRSSAGVVQSRCWRPLASRDGATCRAVPRAACGRGRRRSRRVGPSGPRASDAAADHGSRSVRW